jgi:hypothetical protein
VKARDWRLSWKDPSVPATQGHSLQSFLLRVGIFELDFMPNGDAAQTCPPRCCQALFVLIRSSIPQVFREPVFKIAR